jgi:hypothetical protein
MRVLSCFAVFAVLLAGCGGGRDAGRGALSQDELDWVREMDAWQIDRYRDLDRVIAMIDKGEGHLTASKADPAEIAGYEALLRSFDDCTQSVMDEVGSPPTTRLDPALDSLLEACGQLERTAKTELAAIARGDSSAITRLWPEWNNVFIDLVNVHVEVGRLTLDARRLPIAKGGEGGSYVEPLFSRVATSLAGFDGEVRCWSQADWREIVTEYRAASSQPTDIGGFISSDLSRINLPWAVCDDLAALAYSDYEASGRGAKYDAAASIGLFAHEAMHLSRFWDEREAECYGLQHVAEAARQLGASERYAAELADVVWQEIYPQMPAAYRSPDCRNEGPLDINRGQARWP